MDQTTLFALMVFTVVLVMSQAFVAPLMGSRRAAKKRLRQRIQGLDESLLGESHAARLRKKRTQGLSRLEQRLESLPIMERIATLIAQAGKEHLAYRFVLQSLVIGLVALIVVLYRTGNPALSLLAAFGGAYLPFFLLVRRRHKRLQKFEEQLPDALSVAARSLRAGLPFSEALNMVAKEMQEPINKEFEQVFGELNYGGDLRSALLGLLQRMPSISVMATATAVLIQRETGGNLAEVLDRISGLLRERFRFQRSVRTLTAEGRGTAWVVAVMPFVLAVVTEILKPGWVSELVSDQMGQQLTIGAFVLMLIGIYWLRRLVSIDV